MKFAIILLIFVFEIQLFTDSNAKSVEKRWARDEWPSMMNRWKRVGEDIRRRTDSLLNSNRWIRNRPKVGPHLTSFSNLRPISSQTQTSFMSSNLSPQNFDPSVVIVDKPVEDVGHTFADFDVDIPFHTGFNGPKLWPFGGIFKPRKSWWNGPNVCIERRMIEGSEKVNNTKNEHLEVEGVEDDSGNFNIQFNGGNRGFSFQSTHCSETDTSYTCTSNIIRGGENKTTIVKHQCCHGFKRKVNGFCSQVDLKSLVQTLKDLKMDRMLHLSQKLGFEDRLVKENLTVFSPTDEALIEYQDDMTKNENEVETAVTPKAVRRRRDTDDRMSGVVFNHIMPGFIKSGDFDDEQMLNTLSSSKVRINIYHNPTRVVTANCVPVISPDNYAINGIVHILDRVMPMPSKTIGEIINEGKNFTIIKNIIAKTDLTKILEDNGKHLTFFVPTDAALSRMDKTYLDRLLNGKACVESFIKNHMTGSVLCSSAVQSYAQIKNMLEIVLPLKRDEEKLEVDGIRVIESDKLGTNGVIHVIDGVIITEKSEPISRFLESNHMTQYLNLINETGRLQELDSMTNVSFFVPSLDAINSLSAEQLQQIKNNFNDLLNYHIVEPMAETCNLNNNHLLNTKNGNQIRINVFGDIPGFEIITGATAQCAKLIKSNEDICDSNVHVVDRFLMPPKGNITEMLGSMKQFSILTRILDKSGVEKELKQKSFTLLAPKDEAFNEQLSNKQLDLLLNDQKEAERFSRLHLLPEVVCCSGVNTSPFFLSLQQIKTLDGSLISAQKTINGRVRFGTARVSECDIMATNGVIHVINKLLEPQTSFGTGFQFPLFEMGF